jgi:hypothetical protein
MAILTNEQKAAVSEAVARQIASVTHTKPQVCAAIQAVEDWFDANQSSLNQAINAATSPLTLTVAQKKLLVACWLLRRGQRDGGN